MEVDSSHDTYSHAKSLQIGGCHWLLSVDGGYDISMTWLVSEYIPRVCMGYISRVARRTLLEFG
jgi:hypothetical protein